MIKTALAWELGEIVIETDRIILHENPSELERFKHGISNGQFGISLEEAETLIDELTKHTRIYRQLDHDYLKTCLPKE